MHYDVKLPDIGEGVAEGEIVRWLVRAGDAVKEEQPLVEVMTDKASVEIPSPRTGTIATLHVEEGAMVPVGTVIVHEAPRTCGYGAELSALLAEQALTSLQAPVLRVTGYDTPFPYTLEHSYLPDAPRVMRALEHVMAY